MNPRINILIADDDTDDASFLEEGLSRIITAYNISNVSNGAECLRFLKTNEPPEIIFLDLNMPMRNGVECLRSIKETAALKGTHVIVNSTSHNLKDIDACYKAGATFYLVKPVLMSSMVKMLEEVFYFLGTPKKQVRDKETFVLIEKIIQKV